MKFKSPTEQPIHIALTSGQTALVGPEGADLDPLFHREAVARGCIPDGIPVREHKPVAEKNRREVIKTALQEMIAGEDADDFLGNGHPNKGKLDARLGFKTERSEVDAIFGELVAEAQDEEQQDAADDQTEKTDPDATKATEKDQQQSTTEADEFEPMTRAKLMAYLKKAKVKFETDANRTRLLELARATAAKAAAKAQP